MQELMSRRIRRHFRDLAAFSTSRKIVSAWRDEGFAPSGVGIEEQGVRRTVWRDYEESVDWSDRNHVRRAVSVMETLILHEPEENLDHHRAVLERDGWTLDGKRRLAKQSGDAHLSGLGALRDPGGILDALARAIHLLEPNPAGCVGAAKDLIEATAKTVLEQTGAGWSDKDKLPGLIARAQRTLGLHPATVDISRKSAEATKQILGGLSAIAVGIDMLRNSEGSGHGRSTAPKLSPRHARLAFNAARTWCELVLDTFSDPAAPWH